MTIDIKVKANLDSSGADAGAARVVDDLKKIDQQAEKTGAALTKVGKTKISPVDKGAVEDLKKVERGVNDVTKAWQTFQRLNSSLSRRVNATGQSGQSFENIDFTRMYPNSPMHAEKMRRAAEMFITGRGGSGGGGGGGGGPGWSGSGRNIAGAGLNALGPAGSVANKALDMGMAGGIGAGLGALAGGLAALAIGKVVGKAVEKVGAAQQEFIGYDTLKRTLGDVNVSFNMLKSSLRETSYSLGMTFDEGLKLGTQFTKLSGITGEQSKHLAEEVQVGGGFGRSFGMDPSQSNAFFAQMRQFRVTSDVQGSRQLALMIGESVAKSGASSKADEVLEAVAGFTSQQTRMGMQSANVGGYLGMLTGMIGSKIPGMDPAGAAGILGKVNSSIMGGGNAGEAGQNFIYSAIGSRLGLSPVQTMIMREQGAFGTGRGTFGSGTAWAKFSEQNGIKTPGGAVGSDATNLQILMEHFRKNYAGQPELMVDAMHNLFGIGTSQAMALSTMQSQDVGGMGRRMERLGLDVGRVNATGISAIGQIEANTSLSEPEKDQRIRDTYDKNQSSTLGSEARQQLTALENIAQSVAGEAVPALNSIRAGIMYMAGKDGKVSPRKIEEAIAKTESDERRESIEGDWGAKRKGASDAYIKALNARKGYQLRSHGGPLGSLTEGLSAKEYNSKLKELLDAEEAARIQKEKAELGSEYRDALKKEKEALEKTLEGIRNPAKANGTPDTGETPASWGNEARGADASSRPSNYDALFEKYEQQYGIPAGLLKRIGMKESGLNPDAVGQVNKNGALDYGLMQHNSQYMAERGITNWRDPEQQISAAAKLLAQNQSKSGSWRDATRMYNGSGPKAEAYADQVWGASDTPLPGGGYPLGGGSQTAKVTGYADLNVQITMPGGAAAKNQNVRVPLQGVPVAAGTR